MEHTFNIGWCQTDHTVTYKDEIQNQSKQCKNFEECDKISTNEM